MLCIQYRVRKPVFFFSACVITVLLFFAIFLQVIVSAEQISLFKNTDFEVGDFKDWTVKGDAFGNAPTSAGLPGQVNIQNFHGKYFINSFHNGDESMGSLISQPFTLKGPKIGFLIAGGSNPEQLTLDLLVNEKIVRSATGDNSEVLKRVVWDISEFNGKTGTIEIIDSSKFPYGYLLFDDLLMGDTVTRPGDILQPVKINKPLTKRTPITELVKPKISPDLYTLDFDKGGIHMICHTSGFREGAWTPLEVSNYAAEGYDVDNYYALQNPIAKDKFNAFSPYINFGDDNNAGVICWDSKIPAFPHEIYGNLDKDILAAELAGLKPGVELLTGGIANTLVVKQHPDWQQRNASGRLAKYMGPQVCWNTPYFKESLLPLYKQLFTKYGSRISNVILWEGPHGACFSKYCEEAFQKSGMKDRQEWERLDTLNKWKEIADTIRSTGWKGKIIGGGWAAYEWEEKMWDSTFYNRDHRAFGYGVPEFEAFMEKAIDGIMPELLFNSTYGPHAYRRDDVHYTFRSLMYERSLFGNKIIPNAELFWPPRTMTPDEVFRWLQEVWMAGYDSYSVVNESKLYLIDYKDIKSTLIDYDESQSPYTENYRKVFSAFNSLPSTGLPEINFQFVVSTSLEASLFHPHPLEFSGFMPEYFRDIQKIQVPSNVFMPSGTGAAREMETHNIRRTQTSQQVNENAPCMKLTLENQDYDLEITVLDDLSKTFSLWVDDWNGGDWKDHKVGEIVLKNSKGFVTQYFNLPRSVVQAAQDSMPDQPGKQVALRLWNGDGSWLSSSIGIEKVLVKEKGSGTPVCQLYFGGGTPSVSNPWDWYVKGSNKLFKEVDRTVSGGALVNERVNELHPQELYGWVTPQTPRIMLIPEGCPEPKLGVPAEHVLKIPVRVGEDLGSYKDKIISYLQPYILHRIRNKTPLVYANWTKTRGGTYYLSVVNHGKVTGTAEIQTPWKELKPVISSADSLGHKIHYNLQDGWLKITLESHAGIVLSK